MAISFDGTNDYVDLGINTAINGLAKISIISWIYPTSFGTGPHAEGPILWKGTPSTFTFTRFGIINSGSFLQRLQYITGDAGSTGEWDCAFSSSLLSLWNHVAVTYDTTSTANDAKLYVGGSPQTTNRGAGPSNTNVDTGSTGRIGAQVESSDYFVGNIAAVLIYNRLLSDAEILNSFNAGRAGIYTWAEQNQNGLMFLPNMNMATGVLRSNFVGATLSTSNKLVDYLNCNQYTPTNSPKGA